MAKISILSTDAGRTFTAGGADEVIGSSAADLIYVDASAAGVVIGGGGGADTVTMAGSVDDYTVQADGSRVKLTNATGGVTFVALSESPITINFADATANAMIVGGQMMLGNQNVTGLGSATAITGTSIFTGGTGLMLKDGQDIITGTSGNDTFTSYILDNSNTFESGDIINGGGGTDSLYAEIGNSQNIAINAKTTSVENFFFQAQSALDSSNDNNDNFVDSHWNTPLGDMGESFHYGDISQDGTTTIDAEDLQGVKQLWSDNSRANLVIEDVREDSHLTTIGMRDTDPGNVNYEVYFDPQHITSPGSDAEGATLTIRLADVLDLGKGGDGLSNLPYVGFTLNVGGTSYDLDIDFSALTSYADFKAAIEAALAANGLTGITVAQNPVETAVFSITVTDAGTTYLQGTVGGVYSPIVLTNTGAENLSLVGYTLAEGTQEPSGNLVRTAAQNEAATIPSLTQVDVILDNVARGDASGSGDLVIGDMSESGIQQFNVQVDRSSHIDQMASTNNVLEVINVENIGANGDLIINEIRDVRVFDASTMVGDVSLGAYLSSRVTEKYLDLQDEQTDPADDNSEIPYLNVVDTEFSYDMGTGDDTLNLEISHNNLADAGTTNREDFVLEINGNDGNDDITLSIVAGRGNLATDGLGFFSFSELTRENWYDNSILNANLTINAGAGDDTIRKPGTGNVEIYAGSGNDVVYADNTGEGFMSGRKATWVFNADQNFPGIRDDYYNLQSDANDTYMLYKGTLTVSFKGFEVTVNIPSTNGIVSDLQINQAIKAAINSDDVLSTMLVANDGPANTLVVTSKIDGNMVGDLMVSIDAPTSISAADVTLLNSFYGTASGSEASHLATFAAEIAAFDAKLDYATHFATFNGGIPMIGFPSTHTSDNIIEGDTGDDVLVLGTGVFSNDTVVYNGYDQTSNGLNDYDTIVNFDTTWLPAGTAVVSGASAVQEIINVTFGPSDGDPAAQVITFDGTSVTLSAPATQGVIPAADVAYQFSTGYVGDAEWSVSGLSGNTVQLTRIAGAVTDVAAGDFTGTYVSGGLGVVTVDTVQQGADAITVGSQTVFTVTFDVAGTAADAAGSFTFDGATVAYAEGDGAITLTDKLANATFANWTVAETAPNQVTFTAINRGVSTVGVNADFDLGTNVIVGAVATVNPGTADVGTPIVTQVPAGPGPGLDYLDFSSYDVAGVYVDADILNGLVAGAVPSAANDLYVLMVESTTNDGEYKMYLVDGGVDHQFDGIGVGTDDVIVGTIGIADFGVEQAFVAANFII